MAPVNIPNTPSTKPPVNGAKVILIWQLADAARLAPQLFVWKKFKFVAIKVRVIADAVLLVSVMVLGELLFPTCSEGKRKRIGREGECIFRGILIRPNIDRSA